MVILCSIGDYTQYLVITYNRKESEKEYLYTYKMKIKNVNRSVVSYSL